MNTAETVTREARRVALAIARTYPPHSVESDSLRSYYWSLAQGLRVLEYGTSDPDDCDAFVCYQGLDFDPDLQQRFKAEWGKDIGRASGIINSLATDIKEALEDKYPSE